MKMRLMTFDEACKTYDEKYLTEISFTKEYVFGIGKDAIPWGENVEVNIATFYDNNKFPTYTLNGFFVPTCVFKADDESLDKEPVENDILRYGTILTDDNLIHTCKDEGDYVRIRIIAYDGVIYYHKMLDSEVVEFKKVGVVG